MLLTEGEPWRDAADAEDEAQGLARQLGIEAIFAPESQVSATRVRSRALSCYADFRLVEVTLSGPMALPTGSDEARLYALQGAQEAFLLTGASPVFHSLNGRRDTPLDLSSDEQALEYLRLFCSFVSGEDGSFTIIDTVDDLAWRDDGAGDAFSQRMARRRRAYSWNGRPERITGEELEKLLSDPSYEATLVAELTAAEGRAAAVTSRADAVRNIEPPKPILGAETKEGDDRGTYVFEATVCYARTLFRSTFRLMRSGMVEMTEDLPLTGMLALYRQDFRKVRVAASEATVFVRFVGREKMAPAKFFEKLEAPAWQGGETIAEHVHIDGDLDLSGRVIERPLILKDVEIDGDLILDGARSDHAIEFDTVKIAGRLRGRSLRCGGAFRAPNLIVEGVYDRNVGKADPDHVDHVAVDLSSALIEGRLDLRGLESIGGVDLGAVTVNGDLVLSDAKIDRSEPLDNSQTFGLSLRRAWVRGDIDLAPTRRGANYFLTDQPSIVGRLVLADGEVEGSVRVDALALKAGHSVISASARNAAWRKEAASGFLGDDPVRRVYWSPVERKLVYVQPEAASCFISAERLRVRGEFSAWRLSVEGDFQALSANIGGMLDLRDLTLRERHLDYDAAAEVREHGALDISGIQAAGVFFAGAEVPGSFNATSAAIRGMLRGDSEDPARRTHIGGGLTLSGASINSDLALCGVHVGGRLEMITGSAGRCNLRHTQIRQGPRLKRNCGPEDFQIVETLIGGVFFSACRLRRLTANGLRVMKGVGDADGSFEIIDAEITDDVELFNPNPADYLCWGDVENAQARRDALPPQNAMRARVDGDFTLSGTKIGGTVTLTNAEIGGHFKIDDVEMGALDVRLRHADEGEDARHALMVQSMSIDNLRCRLDCDLEGLAVTGRTTIQRSTIERDLSLPTPLKGEPHSLGRIAKLKANRLGGASLSLASVSGNKRRIDLRNTQVTSEFRLLSSSSVALRADVKDLTIRLRGFQAATMRLDLGKDLASAEDFADVLKCAADTDGKLYTSIIARMRDEGDAVGANRLYVTGRRLQRRKRQWLSGGRLLDWAVDLFTGYWTQTQRMLIPIVAIGLLSLSLVQSPTNIAPTALQLGESRESFDDRPADAEWSHVEKARLWASTVLPIATVVSLPRWEFADRPRACIYAVVVTPAAGACGEGFVEIPLSPATLSFWIQLAGWLCWPIFLVGASGIIQRKGV